MSAPSSVRLQSVLLGRAVPYTRPGTRSGIAKSSAHGAIRVTTIGLAGDEQGDPRVHGGPDKAVHHYPYDHYPIWREQLPGCAVLHGPGAFGENLSTVGWTEHLVCLGDVIRVASVTLQISQGRQPCWKLNDRFAHRGMARLLQSSGRTGWYYRVLEEGELREGDAMTIVERTLPDWPISRLSDLLFHRTLDRDLLEQAAALPLTPSWKRIIANRLQSAAVESWHKRLEGPSGDAPDPFIDA